MSILQLVKNDVSLLEAFNIEEKIADFEKSVNWEDFEHKNIVIAVPTYDESHRTIEIEDRELFVRQKKDAYILGHHIMLASQANLVRIITNADEVDDFVDHAREATAVLILLHEFMDFEKKYIIEGLSENNPILKVIDL